MKAAAPVYLREKPAGWEKITWDKITFPPRTESKERNGKSFGSREDRPGPDGDPRISDAGYSRGQRPDEDGGRRHLRHRRQAVQDAALRRAGDHGPREHR